MVKPIAIASASVVLLIGTAQFTNLKTGGPAHAEASAPLSTKGPIAVEETQEPSWTTSNVDADALAGQLQVLALYGDTDSFTFLDPAMLDSETVWLARCIYSETKLPHEQELVAWVVRNRVETNYRGKHTYRGVILDPYQFSAFNPGHPKRSHYASLSPLDSIAGWQHALRIAYRVRHADASERPFSKQTRHFFSIRSMPGDTIPHWVQNRRRVVPKWSYRVNQRRFQFFEAVS